MSITRIITEDDEIYLDPRTDEFKITAELKRKDVIVYPLSTTNYWAADKNGPLMRQISAEITEMGGTFEPPYDLGRVVKHELNYVTYYGIVCYDTENGWPEESYEAIDKALRQIWDEQEDEFVRPFRAVEFGWRRWKVGETPGRTHQLLKAFAASEAEFDLFCI